jgi:hypothetical protein
MSGDAAGERDEPSFDGVSVDVNMGYPSLPGMIEYYPKQVRSPFYPEIVIALGCAPVDTNHPAVDALAPEFLLGQRHMDGDSSVGRGIRTDQEYLHWAATLLLDEAFGYCPGSGPYNLTETQVIPHRWCHFRSNKRSRRRGLRGVFGYSI